MATDFTKADRRAIQEFLYLSETEAYLDGGAWALR